MLIDPTFSNAPDPILSLVTLLVAGGRGTARTRLARGFYLIGHWNFEDEVRGPRLENYSEDYRTTERDLDEIGLECEYGVCDSPEQFMERFAARMDAHHRKWVVSFVVVRKEDQESRGGWRWHKWGPYIGTAEPQCEYLYDEPVITSATTFHAYRAKEDSDAR